MKNIFSKIGLFKKKDKLSFGLDIGTQEVKCVKLKSSAGAVELVDFSVEEGQLDPREALKSIRRRQGADLVNISFSGPSTVIRYVNFLRMNKNELSGSLKFEAQKHIPFSVNDVNLDAEILKNDLPDNKMLVLIAAVKKDAVAQRIAALENAGLRANLIDIDSLALVNAFNYNYPVTETADNAAGEENALSGSGERETENPGSPSGKQSQGAAAPGSPSGKQSQGTICLLNVGSSITSVNILDNRLVRLSRDIHFGGVNFTRKIMDLFEMDFKSAEASKINPPSDKAARIRASMEGLLTSLASEIRTSFDYYESQNTVSVSRIFLSGGAGRMAGLRETLSASLGLPVETWDPFRKIIIPDTVDKKKLEGLSGHFNVAVGLALR